MKKGFIGLWIVFVLLVLSKFRDDSSSLPGLIALIWSAGLSVFLLIKNGLPSKKGLIVSVVLTALVFLSGLARDLSNGTMIFTVLTLIASLAVTSVGEKTDGVKLIRSADAKGILISVLIGSAAAVPLIIINTLANTGGTVDPDFSLLKIFWAVKPGISEDMVMRAVFMAFCVYLTKNDMTKAQSVTMYIMMAFPHGLMHNMNIITCVFASIIFGLPFTFLQRKRDITSAMVSHFWVDAVRFIIFGG